MRIRRLELQGFKSFADRTVLRLSPGTCAVVGPNGCGKSNVVDALRWTLGEQSAGTLRGRAMEDVIFAGSDGRAPAGRAEVVVVFDNSDGRFGGDLSRFAEIEVARRLHRGGRSEYLLNKTPCRLKDITRLFLDTGVGARAYSIIEQGRVAFIVQARPRERRVLVDEVAGINRFKAQRQEAERRLAKTRENLARAADLVDEMGKRRRSLQAQAERAERFRSLRGEWRRAALLSQLGGALARRLREADLERRLEGLAALEATVAAEAAEAGEIARATHEAADAARRVLDDTRTALGEARAGAALLRQEATLKRDEQERLSATVPDLRTELADAEGVRASLEKEVRRFETLEGVARVALTRVEAELAPAVTDQQAREESRRLAREQVEAAKAAVLGAMTAEAKADGSTHGADAAHAALVERIARHDAEGEARTRARDEARTREAAAGEAVTEAVAARVEAARAREEAGASRRVAREALERARAEQGDRERSRLRAQARRDSLAELVDGYADLGGALQDFLRDPPAGVLGLVADLLPVDSPLVPALQAAAPDVLEAVAVRDPSTLEALAADPPPGLGFLVSADGGPALEDLLADSLTVVDDPAGLAAPFPEARRVTETGWSSDGLLVRSPGERSDAAGRIARRAELAALDLRLQAASADVAAAERRVGEAEPVRGRAEEAWAEAADRAHQAELAELSARRDRDQARRERASADEAVSRAAAARSDLVRRAEAADEERLAAGRALAAAREERASAGSGLEEARARLGAREAEADEGAEALTELRASVAERHRAADMAARDRDYARERMRDADRRFGRSRRDLERVRRRQDELTARLGAIEGEIADQDARAERLSEETARAEELRRTSSEEATFARERGARLSGRRETTRAEREGCEGALAEVRAGLEARRVRAARDFDVDIVPLLAALLASPTGETEVEVGASPVTVRRAEIEDADAARRRDRDAVRLSAAIDALGPVNLAAPAEFRDVDARWQKLRAAATDLETAVADLRRAIERIDKETRSRFKDAFAAVSARFEALYPRLVGGGRAELRLVDPGDLLGTGIEIVVQPPGKRLSHLTLLSGGEKAMAAVALLFAIFQVKPSPFCVLDEVDAPLDEANSRRFNAMLRELSTETQFIVITHNRTTMEVADVLHGVTMQDPGVSTTVAVRLDR